MDKNELKEVLLEVEKEKRMNDDLQPEAGDIDYREYLVKLWAGRRFIMKATGVFIVLGLIGAFMMTRTYTTTVTLVPELGKSSSNSSLSSLTGMLGLGGAMTGSSADAYNVTVYPEVVASTPFATKLFDIRVSDPEHDIDTTLIGYLTREQFSISGLVIKPILSLFSTDSIETSDKVDIFRLTKEQSGIVKYLNKAIAVDVDKKSGETTINVTMDNPVVAAIVADSVCSYLREFVTEYRTRKAREDFDNYQKISDESHEKYLNASRAYAYYQDHNRGLTLNAVISEGTRLSNELNIASQVYSQAKLQAEAARGKIIDEKPVFAIIQPASVPLQPSNSRKKVVLIWTFIGFVLSCVWVLYGKEYWGKGKGLLSEVATEKNK
ncbi:MAG: chain-length determining protein [Prevotella sp.]|nr:chain-length determining protein [Prevotella sp.]